MLNKKIFKILKLFKFFLSCIEHNINKYIQIYINNDFEYFNKNFIKFIIERKIRIEFITIENFQINNCVERFNQIFMRKINIFFQKQQHCY